MQNDPRSYLPTPGIVETELEDELVLLDPERGEMFALNPTGRAVWRALPAPGLDALVAAVVAEFDVEPAQAEADVRALVAELLEAGLVRRPASDVQGG